MKRVRVRFAPSPTGALHIGGLRTALFNYLFAKRNNGDFILRIEDTDQSRYVEGSEKYIYDSLKWAGFEADESPEKGGSFAPYKQSERQSIYKKYIDQLLNDDLAYYAFDSTEELDEMRNRLKEAGVANLHYNSVSRKTMKNSLTLSKEEVQRRIEEGDFVIRIKIPEKEEVRLNDLIRGWVHVHGSTMDDKVLMKSDGLPTYHFANVVDDHLMEISHVIRGEEWLPSAPLHVLLYKYLGWEETMPEFAHLPLILKPDGNGKLSKRAADKAGFPIFPLTWKDQEGLQSEGFKESGYLPEAVTNFLALLGWSSGTDQEIFSLSELEKSFSIDRVGKAGTKFDIDKAKWFNQQYLNDKNNQELGEFLKEELLKKNIDTTLENCEKISGLLKTRISFLHELVSGSLIFFRNPEEYDDKVRRKKWNPETEDSMKKIAAESGKYDRIDTEKIDSLLSKVMGDKVGSIMQVVRLCLTGTSGGPDLKEIWTIMGGKYVEERINYSISELNKK